MGSEDNNEYNPSLGKSLETWLDIPKNPKNGRWDVNWRLLGLRLVAYGFPVLSLNIIGGASTRMLIGNMLAIIASVVHNYLTNAGNGNGGKADHCKRHGQ